MQKNISKITLYVTSHLAICVEPSRESQSHAGAFAHLRRINLLLLVRLFQLLGIGRLARIAIIIYKKIAKQSPYILPSAFRGRGALGFPGF